MTVMRLRSTDSRGPCHEGGRRRPSRGRRPSRTDQPAASTRQYSNTQRPGGDGNRVSPRSTPQPSPWPAARRRRGRTPPRFDAGGSWFDAVEGSFNEPVKGVDQLLHLFRAILVSDGVADTAVDMAAHHLQRDFVQRPASGGDLLKHVDAVAAFLQHPLDALDLAFDLAKAHQALGMFRGLRHLYTHYWYGVYRAEASRVKGIFSLN